MFWQKLLRVFKLNKGGDPGGVNFKALPKLLTIEQVSELLGVHPNTLRNWDKAGKLKAVRLGPRRDRRYEKESVQKMYHSLPVPEKKPVTAPLEKPEENYVLKPAFSWRWLRLFLISKRFSVFVYSAYLIAFTFAVIQVTFFAYMYRVQAEMRQPEIFHYQLAPVAASGWQSPQQARHIDLLSNAEIEAFTDKNSAVFINQPVSGTEGVITAGSDLGQVSPQLDVAGFALPKDAPLAGTVKKANIIFSLAADSFQGNEDVLDFIYTLDGTNWISFTSLPLDGSRSNATHGGFWSSPLDLTTFTTDSVAKLQVRAIYNAVPGEQVATVYLDGVALEIDIQEPESVVAQIEKSVAVPQEDFKADEEPVVTVEVEEKKALGLMAKKRTIKELHVTDPTGQEVKADNIKTGRTTKGNLTKTEYAIATDELKKPGKYTVILVVEQDGQTKIVTREFTWGVLVINTMKSVYRPGETVNFGVGVLDSGGHTICDAALVLTITSPSGGKSVLSTQDQTITYSKECGYTSITNLPDYAAQFEVTETGTYTTELKATTKAGDYTITDALPVQNKVAFDITRLGPMRVYPAANYQMFLEVTPESDYTGVFEEFVPASFEIPKVGNDGLVSPLDEHTKAIRWIVDWQAGQPYTLSYEMDPPNVSPEIFLLGKAKVGSFTESRQWQIASDAVCTASVTGNWSNNATWGGLGQCNNSYPGAQAGDSAIINSGVTVTLDVTPANSITTLTINDPGKNVTALNFNAFRSLTTTGAVTLTASTNTGTSTIAVATATFNPASIAIGGGASAASTVSVSTGTITVGGSITFSGTASNAKLTSTSTSTINIAGSLGSGGTLTTSGTGTIVFNGTGSQTMAAYTTYNNVQVNNASLTVTTQGTTTIGGTLTITAGTLTMGNAALTVTGTSSITGTINTATGSTGTRTFTGAVTVNSGGTWNLSGQNPATSFAGGITMNGTTFNNGSGATAFTASQALAGSSAMTFGGAVTISNTFTLTNNNSNTVTFSSTVNGGGATANFATGASSTTKLGSTVMSTGTLTPSASSHTVDYTGADQAVKAPSLGFYYHLTLSGSGTPTLPGAMTMTGNFTTSGTVTPSLAGNTTVSGNLSVGSGTNLTAGAFGLTVTGTSSITGELTISSATGTKRFTGAVTINSGGTWTNSGNSAINFRGGLTNDSANSHTFGSGVQTFDTNSQAVGGTNEISIPSVTVTGVTLTNDGTLTVTTALAGTGGLTNSATGTLNLNFTGAVGITTLTASASGNTVNYGYAGAQTVRAVTYHHLTLSGSGAKTMTSVSTINGDLTLSGTATATTDTVTTLGGDISLGTGTTLTIGANIAVNGGDITVTSTGALASSGTPTVTMGAAGAISGTGNVTIYNLTISASGTTTLSATGTNSITNNVSVSAGSTIDIQQSVATGSITTFTTGIIASTSGTPTVTVSGTSIGGGSGAITFYNLTKSGAGSTTWTSSVGGNTVKNDLTISAGTFVAPAGTLTIGGSFDNNAAFTHSSGTLTFNATSGSKTIDAGSSQLNNVIFNGSGGGWSFSAATTTLAGDLTVTDGTLSGTTNIIVNGSDIVCGASCGTITLTGGTVTMVGTGNLGTALLSTTWTFASLSFGDGTIKTTTTQGTGTITVTSVLTLNDKHILDAGAKTWTLSGTGTPFVDNGGAVTSSTSTFKYTGAGATNITPESYNNLQILPGAASATHTMKSGNFAIDGNLTLGDGSYTSTTITAGGLENPTISVAGNVELCASPCTNDITFTKSSGTFTWRPSGTKTWTDNNSVKQDLGTVSITGGSSTPKIQLASAAKATSIAVAALHELQLNSKDLTLSGALTTATTGTITCASCNAGTVTARTTLGGGSGGITFYNLTLDNTTTLSSSFTVLNNLTLPASVTAGSTTITMTGTAGAIVGGGATVNSLTIDPSSAGTTTLNTSNLTVSGTLTVAADDTISLSSGRTLSATGAAEVAGTGTISGDGTLRFTDTSGGPGATITTLSSVVRYDATGGNIASTTLDARTYGGKVEIYSNSGLARTATLANGTYILSGSSSHLHLMTEAISLGADITLVGATNNPTVTIGGDLDFTGTGVGSEIITSGTSTWTLSGNVNFSDGTYTATSGNTVAMNGTSKTITSNGQALQNFVASAGSISNVDALNVDGTFVVNNGSFTQGANVDVNVAGNFTITSEATFSKASGSGKLIFDGDLQFLDQTAGLQDLGAVEIGTSPDTTTLTSDLKATSLTVKSLDVLITDGYDLDIGTGGITIDGTLNATQGTDGATTINSEGGWTMNSGGAFTYDNSTVTLDGSASKNIAGTTGTTFYNLTITTGDAVITASDHTVTGTLNVDTLRTLTINVSRILNLNSGGSLTLGGIITGAGTFVYKPSAAFPTGGTISSILRFDATDNDQTMSNRTYGGAVELYNTTAVIARTVTGAAGTITLSSSISLTQTGGKSVIWNLNTSDPSVTVNGAVTIGSGTELSASNSSILDLKGDYTNSGTFTDNLGTVRASGTSQQTLGGTMTGSSDFRSLTVTNAGASNPDVIFSAAATAYTFTATTASSQIQFLAGANYTFTNINLNGQATGTRVVLSSSTTSQWNLIVSGTQTVSNTSVSYSNACLGNNIAAYDGTNNDGLNNNCWDFTNLITVTGVLYDTTRSTPYNCATDPGTPITIKISTSGRAAETTACTLSDGTFSFTNVTGPLQAGDPVIVYVDSAETPQATTVTRGSGPFDNIIGLDLYQNDVIVRHEDAGPVTNSDLSDGDNGEAGIRYSVATSNLTVDSGLNLYVWAGDTYDPGGTVTTQGTTDLFVGSGATASLDTATSTISDDIDNYGTLNVTATTNVTDSVYVRSGSTLTSSTTATISNDVHVYGDLNVTAGTFTVGDALVEDMNVYSGATVDLTGGTTDIKDDLILLTGGTVTVSSILTIGSQVYVDVGALNINTGADVDIDENIDQNGGTITISGGATNLNTVGVASSVVSVDNATFTVSGGTLTVGAGATDYFQVNSGANVDWTGGTVSITDILDMNGGTLDISNTATIGDDIDQDGGTLTINSGANVDVTDSILLDAGTLNLKDDSGTGSSLDSSGYWYLNQGTFNLYGGTHSTGTNGRLYLTNAGASALDFNMIDNGANPDGQITTGYLFTGSAAGMLTTTTVTGGTIVIGSAGFAGARYIYDTNGNSHEFYNMTIAEDAEIHGSTTQTINLVGALTINNTKTFTANSKNMRVDGGWVNNGSFGAGLGTVTLRGGNVSGSADTSFYNLTVGDGTTSNTVTVNGTDDPAVTNTLGVDTGDTLSIGSGRTVTHSGGSMTLDGTISGAGTLRFTNTSSGPGSTGILSSVVRYDATGGDIAATTLDARTYGGKVEIYSESTSARNAILANGTYTLSGSSAHLHIFTEGIAIGAHMTLIGATNNPTVTIGGDLDFMGGGTGSEIITSGTGTWTVTGSIDFTGGTFTASAGNTLKMNGTSKSMTSAGQTLQNFEVSGGSITTVGATDVNGTFTVSAGTITQAANDNLNVAGNFTLATGTTFTKASGTGQLIFDGTAAATYTDSTATPQNLGEVIFNKTSGVGVQDKVTLASDMTVDTADIQTGDTLDLASNSYTLTLANAGATATVLTVSGTLTPGTSTVKYSATNSGGTINVTTTTYNSVQFSGAETYDLTGHLTVGNGLTGGVTIDSGATLNTTASNYNIDIAGNWTNNGDFTDNSSTVTFDGSSQQTLSGQMTGASDQFYNLTITNAGAANPDVIFSASTQTANDFTVTTASVQLQFLASATYTFQNINWNGQAVGTRVDLNSSSPGTQWNLVVSGTQAISYVDAQDSNACGGNTISANNGTNNNSGNNTCWDFGLTLSGTLYKNETGTTYNCTLAGDDEQTVAISVGGAAKDTGTCIAVNGTFSVNIKSPAGAGTPVVVFIDDEVVGEGTVATRAASATANISGINVYKDVVAVRHEDSGPITNANLDTADSAFDDDIKYTVVTGASPNLTVVSGFELHIGKSGTNYTFDPGGTVTTQGTGSLHLDDGASGNGTVMYIDTDTSTIANNITIDSPATLSIDSSRNLTLATGKTLTMGGASSTIAGSGTFIYQPSTAFPTGGTVSANVRFDSESNDQIVSARTYGGNVEIYNNEVALGTRTITLGTGASQTISISGNLTLTEVEARDINLTGATYNPAVNVVGNISFTAGGGSELITSGTGIWTVTGNIDFTGGTYTASEFNTIKMNGTTKTIKSAGNTLQNFQVDIGSGTISNVDALNVDGNFYISKGAFTQGANVNVNVAGNFTIDSGFTFTKAAGSGLLIFDSVSAKSFTDSTSPLQDVGNVQVTSGSLRDLATNMKATSLLINNSSTMRQEGHNLDIGGDITLNNGGLWPASGEDINLEGSLNLETGAILNDHANTDITFDGTSGTVNIVTASDCGDCSLPNVVINDGGGSLVVEVEDPLDIDGNLTITNGTLDVVDVENNQINVGGNWSNSDIFTARSGTVVFDATTTGHTINPGSSSFYNLTFNGSGGAWSPLTNTVTITNDLTMIAGTFDTSSGTANVTVRGHVQCSGTCGTINMTSTNTFTHQVSLSKNFGTNVLGPTNWTFYNLTFYNTPDTSPTITINGTDTGSINVLNNLAVNNTGFSMTVDNETNDRVFDINGNFSIASQATFQASSTAAFTVGGNWTNNGDFTDGTGTVTLDGTGQQTVSGQLTGASDQFNNLIITNAGAANPDVIFSASAQTAATFTANTANTQLQFLAGGTYTFQNIAFNGQAENSRVVLRSSSTGTQWNINVAGTRSVSNTNVRDSNACGQAPDIDASDGTNFNATNNDCWLFNTLTFTISDTTVGFGDLGAAAARWATGDGQGTGSQPAVGSGAHEIAVTTNAEGGYVLTYYGTNLASDSDTITAATIAGDGDGTPGSKQFALSASTTGNGTVETAYAYSSNNYSFVPTATTTLLINGTSAASDTIDVYYISNISGVTLPGSYSTSITYIVTATF